MSGDAGKAKEQTVPAASRWHSARARLVACLVVVAAVAAGLLLVTDQGGSDRPLVAGQPPPSGEPDQGDPSGERDVLAGRALVRQEGALRQGSRTRYVAAWDARTRQARQRAQRTYTNLTSLGISTIGPRYVAADTGLSLHAQGHFAGAAWKADVKVDYAIPGFDRAPARTTLSYTFVRRGGTVRIVDIEPADGQRMPIWLLGRLEVARSARTLVAATTAAVADRVSRQLHRAVRDVEEVLPSWSGKLVAYIPGNSSQLEAVLAAAPGSYDGIAAVTTTVDGSVRADAPVAIVVNAAVFDDLGPIGSHVVMTHESTHVATGAALVAMPLWVAEGFADYVGVGSVEVPASVAAQAVIRDVRRDGVPSRLPADDDFRAGSGGLEVYYEQAWLANRLIAQRYGQPALVRFYTSVVERPRDLAGAFDRLGTSERRFTSDWRAHLGSLLS